MSVVYCTINIILNSKLILLKHHLPEGVRLYEEVKNAVVMNNETRNFLPEVPITIVNPVFSSRSLIPVIFVSINVNYTFNCDYIYNSNVDSENKNIKPRICI